MIALKLLVKWPDTVIEIAATLLVALILRIIIRKLIDRLVIAAGQRAGDYGELQGRSAAVVATSDGVNANRTGQRAKTLGSVLKPITDVVLGIIALLTILNAININIMPALASAGVVGVAVAFGAQTLVRDLLSGIFMLMEDQYGVGDIIEVKDLKGTVRSVGFRVTEIQDFNGEVWYVRNGEVSTVGNISQGYSASYFSVPVSNEEDPRRVIRVLNRMLEQMDSEPDWHNKMLEAPTVLGLSSFTDKAAEYKIMIKCPANKQWEVEREIRSRALAALAHAGIHMPHHIVSTAPAARGAQTAHIRGQRRRRGGKNGRGPVYPQAANPNMSNDALTDSMLSGPEVASPADQVSVANLGAPEVPPIPDLLDDTAPLAGGDFEPFTYGMETVEEASDQTSRGRMPSVKKADPSQIRKARTWLDRGADRSVRWVSNASTVPSEVHDMTAEETVLLNTSDILRNPKTSGTDNSAEKGQNSPGSPKSTNGRGKDQPPRTPQQ